MKRFMIGQYGNFDQNKQIRDFRKDFFGVEACMMKEESCIKKITDVAFNEDFKISIHFPLRADSGRLRDPQFLSMDESIRKDSYEYMNSEINFLKEIKPHYVLMHYPKPVILDNSVDWTNWRFANDTEYYFEDEISFEHFSEKSEELFEWFSDISVKNDFIPVLEFDALNRYIYDSDFLENLLEKYPRIKLCLDIGRLHLQDRLDDNFDSFEVTKRFSKYAEVVHLWNVKVNSNLEHSHFPALPHLKPEDGWADVERYLRIINGSNKSYKVLFEHRSDLITDLELEACYNWINNILSE